MITIRATKKILLKAKTVDVESIESNSELLFSEWYADLASTSFRGKSFILFLHKPSLMSILVQGKSIEKAYKTFVERLENLLLRFGFPKDLIAAEINGAKEHVITKTVERRYTGFMNGIKDHLLARGYNFSSFEDFDLEREEDILMEHPYTFDKKFTTPNRYWKAYFTNSLDFNLPEPKQIVKMPKSKDLSLLDEENLHFENELLQLKLQAEFGAKVIRQADSQLPPEILNVWLNNVYNFEKKHDSTTEVIIYDYIGRPLYAESALLDDNKLSKMLKHIEGILSKHQIILHRKKGYSDRLIYTFITEKLFFHKIHPIDLPGFTNNLIYEEFLENEDD